MMELWQFRGRVAYWPFFDPAQSERKAMVRVIKFDIGKFEAAKRDFGPNEGPGT